MSGPMQPTVLAPFAAADFVFRRGLNGSFADQARFRRCAAHVEGKQIGLPDLFTDKRCCDDTCGGS